MWCGARLLGGFHCAITGGWGEYRPRTPTPSQYVHDKIPPANFLLLFHRVPRSHSMPLFAPPCHFFAYSQGLKCPSMSLFAFFFYCICLVAPMPVDISPGSSLAPLSRPIPYYPSNAPTPQIPRSSLSPNSANLPLPEHFLACPISVPRLCSAPKRLLVASPTHCLSMHALSDPALAGALCLISHPFLLTFVQLNCGRPRLAMPALCSPCIS